MDHIAQKNHISERFQYKWATNGFLHFWQVCLLTDITYEIRDIFDITVKPIFAAGLMGKTIAVVFILIYHKT